MKTTFVAGFVALLSVAAAQGPPGVLVPSGSTLIFEPIPTGSASYAAAWTSAAASGVAKPTGKPIGTGGYASPTGGSYGGSNGTVPSKPTNSVVPYKSGAEQVVAGGSLVAAVAAAVLFL